MSSGAIKASHICDPEAVLPLLSWHSYRFAFSWSSAGTGDVNLGNVRYARCMENSYVGVAATAFIIRN
jgi:hypothetical protein